ncbi:hypothetical protein K501DRAFT_274776 [Backusella circina FSU 941]|nr:hypothetical protein K501DRAFT_274776 [Backusella circina FSU 941]
MPENLDSSKMALTISFSDRCLASVAYFKSSVSGKDVEVKDVGESAHDTSTSNTKKEDVSKEQRVELRKAIRRVIFNYDGKKGMKTIQLVGSLTSKYPGAAIKSTPSTVEKKKNKKNDRDFDHQIALQQTEVDALQRIVQKSMAERRNIFIEYNVRRAKNGQTVTGEMANNESR